MSEKDFFILSGNEETKKSFEEMIKATTKAILSSYSDNSAFSGVDPYVLREQIGKLGFLPEKGSDFYSVLDTVSKQIMPNLLRTWSTRYMPHLHAPALTETIAAELIIAAFNDSMDSWDQGPAATELEESMIHGLTKLFGLGDNADGTFTSGGTQSNFSAILAARDRYCLSVLGHDVKKLGLPADYYKFRLYTSEVSHFSMEKSCHILGLGYNSVRKIPVDSTCRVDTAKFEKMLEEDKKAGFIPFCAVATIGTTDYGSIDDTKTMRKLCDKYNMHLHADAAYGSALILSSKYGNRLDGIQDCDSITVDFHKMFLLPISCSAVLFKNRDIQKCFEIHADYLNREEDEEDGYINLVDKSIQTTRRFDALKVFMAFQTRGKEGFDKMLDILVGNASYFYEKLSSDDDFIVPVEPQLSSVVFAIKGGDDLNKNIRKHLMANGTIIGQTTMNNITMLKFTLLNPNLTHDNLDDIIKTIKQTRDKLA